MFALYSAITIRVRLYASGIALTIVCQLLPQKHKHTYAYHEIGDITGSAPLPKHSENPGARVADSTIIGTLEQHYMASKTSMVALTYSVRQRFLG